MNSILRFAGIYALTIVVSAFILTNAYSIKQGYGVIPLGVIAFFFAGAPLAIALAVLTFPLLLLAAGMRCSETNFIKWLAASAGVATVIAVVIVLSLDLRNNDMGFLGTGVVGLTIVLVRCYRLAASSKGSVRVANGD